MEIEAKFVLPDRETFRRLEEIDGLVGYALSQGQVKQVRDTYFDTAERTILASGYACRRRAQDGNMVLTLKRLTGVQGAVHRREEMESPLPSDGPPGQWPASPVRDRVLEMTGQSPLVPLVGLEQRRIVRLATLGERLVAEFSLDEVHLRCEGQERTYFELEVELASEGTEDDLGALVNVLQDEWRLKPQMRSKFERALIFCEEVRSARVGAPRDLLSTDQRRVCLQIAAREDLYGRRARALLALDEGATQTEAGERVGMSSRRVRHWLAAFREKGLGIFPERVMAAAGPGGTILEPEVEPQPEAMERQEPWEVEALLDRYQVDRDEARRVADHALILFDRLLPTHGLPPERRSLVETAALVHDIGKRTDPKRRHIVGREILLSHPLAGLDDQERRMVATAVFLQRERMSGQKVDGLVTASLGDLPAPHQAQTLALAALVRMAAGLDSSQTGTSRLGQAHQREDEVEIEVLGPQASRDAGRANRKSDLWRLLFEGNVRFEAVERGTEGAATQPLPVVEGEAPPRPQRLAASPGLVADDSMAEAARKTLLFHFQRMVAHEAGTRAGEDIEELHDMRVATRRMRAAYRVFGEYLDAEEMRPFVKGLRGTGRALGGVRDLDVFWERTRDYLGTLSPARQGDLECLEVVWGAERDKARERMLAYLDGDGYARFKEEFCEFLQRPGAGALPEMSSQGRPRPHRVRHLVPVVVYRRLAIVRAYDEWVAGPSVPLERYHRLRIEAKGLRYALEFFQEVLGKEASPLIERVKSLQDHLGSLQDAVVASNLLRDFLTWGTWGRARDRDGKVPVPKELIVAPGVAAYLAARQSELQHLLETFPQAWARIQSPKFGQQMAAALATL